MAEKWWKDFCPFITFGCFFLIIVKYCDGQYAWKWHKVYKNEQSVLIMEIIAACFCCYE